MNKKEKLAFIADAYLAKKVEDARESVHVISDKLTAEQKEAVQRIQQELNDDTGCFELDYDIMYDACNEISDIDLADLHDMDFRDPNIDCASPYTGKRLSYLTINNQEEITEITVDASCDIAQACADWYNQKVENACEMLKAYILAE